MGESGVEQGLGKPKAKAEAKNEPNAQQLATECLSAFSGIFPPRVGRPSKGLPTTEFSSPDGRVLATFYHNSKVNPLSPTSWNGTFLMCMYGPNGTRRDVYINTDRNVVDTEDRTQKNAAGKLHPFKLHKADAQDQVREWLREITTTYQWLPSAPITSVS